MPEIYRSLVVVLAIAMMVFAFAKAPMVAMGMSLADFKLRRNLWFGITLAAFLSNNFWVFCAVTACLLVYGVKRDSNTLALVFSLLFAVPLFGAEIPGFGLVNYLFDITYFRLISLMVLLPLYLRLRKEKQTIAFGKTTPDKFLIAYLLLDIALRFPSDTFTNMLRIAFDSFMEVVLPYYVASRFIKNMRSLQESMTAFVMAAVVIGVIGVFEMVKGWLLYSALTGTLGLSWGLGGYLLRGNSLRAIATTGQAIVLGYVMAVSLGFFWAGRKAITKSWMLLGFAALAAGLVAPLSRGPWVGVVVGVVIFTLTGPRPGIKLAKVALIGALCFLAMLVTPFGATIVDHLPFIGTVDEDNVVFRQRLLTNSLMVISRNPFFGSPEFFSSAELQELKSGGDGGIVDLVNTYLVIILKNGLVGLTLFAGFFLSILSSMYRLTRNSSILVQDQVIIGRILFATLSGILIVIYTVSSITFIPIIYWFIAGLGVAYARVMRQADVESA